MAPKRFELKLLRPRLGVGIKTLGALSAVFWIPILCLTALLFYTFQDTLRNEVLTSIKINLKGAQEIYLERPGVVSGVLTHSAAREGVRQDFSKKDSRRLQSLLLDLAGTNNFVDVWLAVDGKQRVIARGTDKKGDVVKIGNAISNALATGDTVITTELVSREFLAGEDAELAKRVKDIGVMQFVISPVRGGAEGALVAGILLTGDPWLGNAVFSRYGAELALFAGDSPDSALLHATSSKPRSTWALGTRLRSSGHHDQ